MQAAFVPGIPDLQGCPQLPSEAKTQLLTTELCSEIFCWESFPMQNNRRYIQKSQAK